MANSSFYTGNPTPSQVASLEALVAQVTIAADKVILDADAAEQAALEAQASQVNAAANDAASALSAGQASTSASNAATAASTAQGHATTASTAMGTTLTYRDDTFAARATTLSYRDTTLTYRNDAQGFRNEAESFKNDAAASAVLAATFNPANFYTKVQADAGFYSKTQIDTNIYTKTQIDTQMGAKAPLASPAFTGTATFGTRPTFNGQTPWDAGNFTPGNYFTKTEADTRFVVPANRVLNSTFRFNGRQAANADNGMPVDRWITVNSASTAIIRGVHSSVVSPYGSSARVRHTVITALASLPAGAFSGFYQFIEGFYLQDAQLGTAQAKPLVLRFGVRSSVAGNFGVSACSTTGDRSWVGMYNIAAGEVNTDVIRTFVIPASTTGTWDKSTGIGMQLRFATAVGTSYHGAAGWNNSAACSTSAQTNLAATAGATWEIFDVGLYVDQQGTGVVPPFEAHEYHAETNALLRYFRWVSVDVRAYSPGAGYFIATSQALSPPMRVAPTAGTSNNMPGVNSTGGSLVTGLTVGFLSPHHVTSYWQTAGAGDAYALGFGVPLSAEM